MRARCGSCPAWQGCVGRRGWEVVVEEVGHMVDPLVVDAAAVHLADQGVPLLPPCPSLPPLSPPSLLAQPSFQAAGTTLQGSGGGSSPNNLGFTPSLHITLISRSSELKKEKEGDAQPPLPMVPGLLSHGGGGRNWIPGQCGVNLASYWSSTKICSIIG